MMHHRWDGTAAGATPIINWLLALDHTATYDDPPGQPPEIRVRFKDGTGAGRILNGDEILRRGDNLIEIIPARRQATIRINPEDLRGLLDLPLGMHARFVYALSDPAGIGIIVEGDALDPVDPQRAAPALGGHFLRRQMYGPDGLIYHRYGWEREQPNEKPVLDGRLAELMATATAGDLIILRARDLQDADHLHEQLTDFKGEHPDIDVLVLAPGLNAQVVPADKRTSDDPFDAHRAELTLAAEDELTDSFVTIDGDTFVSLAAVTRVLAELTWPTYVESVGAHALLEDADERLRAAGLKPVGE